jgi:hypothetical protein
MKGFSRVSTLIDKMTVVILGILLVVVGANTLHDTPQSEVDETREVVSSGEISKAYLAAPMIPDFQVPRTQIETAHGFCKQRFAGKKRVIRLCKRIQNAKANQIERARYHNWVKKHRGDFSAAYWMVNIQPQIIIARAYMKATNASIKDKMRALNRLLPKKPSSSQTKTSVRVSWTWLRGTTYRVTYNRHWSAKAAGKYLTEGVNAASLALCGALGTVGPLKIAVFAAGGCTAMMSGLTSRYKDVMKQVRNDTSTCLQISVSFGASQLMMFGNVFRNPVAVPCVWK